jgi:hypothetical protein
MIKFRDYISITLLLVSITDLFSQNDQVILDMQVPGGKTVMINHSGKVVKVFEPNEKVQFDEDISKIWSSLSLFSTYVTYDFTNGPLPVKSDSTWRTYDINGKIVKEFGNKYKILTAPSEGIYKAYEEIKGKHREFNIIYVDKDGKELFDGKRFYEGTQSMNNIAFAKELKESKEWVILNTKDGSKKIVPSSLSKPFYKIKFKTNKYAIGTLQSNYNEVVLDIEGNIVFDPTEVIKGRNVIILKITDDFIVFNKGDIYYFINKELKLVKRLENILGINGMNKKFIFINNGEYFNNLFNLDFSKAIIPLKENEVFICTHLTEDILGGIYVDTVDNKSVYKIIDANTLVELGRTEENIGDIFSDMLVAVDPASRIERKLIAILNTKGQKIYEVDPSDKIFKGINSTNGVDPNKVKYIEIKKDDDISSLSKFKNLESIEFYQSSFTELPPSIKKLAKLKNIRLVECDQLKVLPKWLSGLKFIEKLDLSSCKNLKEIEIIIPTLKSLKTLNTMNYTMSQSFKDQLKKSNPNLIINDWFGSRNDDEEIMIDSKN